MMSDSDDKENQQEHQDVDNTLIFRAAMSNIFKSIAESVSEKRFLECLTFMKSKPSTVHKLHEVMTKELYEGMNADLQVMLDDGNISDGLEKVKRLLLETSASPEHVAWRPPGDVVQHLRSHEAEKILIETEKLQKLVDELEAENCLLLERVKEKRAVAQQIDENVRRATKTGSLAVTQMGKIDSCMQKYFDILHND